MKFFFVMQNLYPVWGGAEKSADTLIKLLESKGHTVEWMCQSNQDKIEPQLNEIMKDVDVVVTQLIWTPKATSIAEKYNKKCVAFIRSYENVCRIVFSDPQFHADCGQKCTGCKHKITGYEPQGMALRKADLIISNSRWMKLFLHERHGLQSEVVYPFINFDDYKIENNTRKYIAMNQMSYAKGADVFLEIARSLPTENFKLVGNQGWMPPVDIPRNVTMKKFQSPEELYGDVWLWLNPARWEEPFGRTVIEAQLAGVPVLTSNYSTIVLDGKLHDSGGLKIKDFTNVHEWKTKIKKIKKSPKNYINKDAHTNLEKFSSDVNTKKFIELMEKL
jgi:glycosyltransferase involved in cell wall biosynthesis